MIAEVRSVELPSGVSLQYAEQGDSSGVPVLLLHDCIEGGERSERLAIVGVR